MFRTSRRINKQQTDGRRLRSGRSRIFRKCKRQLARKIKITCNTSERRTTRESDRRPIAFKAEVKTKTIPSHANVGQPEATTKSRRQFKRLPPSYCFPLTSEERTQMLGGFPASLGLNQSDSALVLVKYRFPTKCSDVNYFAVLNRQSPSLCNYLFSVS